MSAENKSHTFPRDIRSREKEPYIVTSAAEPRDFRKVRDKNLSLYAPFALRIGLFVVFALFGLQKLSNPSQSASEIQLLMNWNISNAAAMNYYLGLIEIILAISFVIGFKIKTVSLIASGLLILFFSSFLFKYGLSINPNLYRDIGLLGATLALFLGGAGPLSLDSRATDYLEINQKNK